MPYTPLTVNPLTVWLQNVLPLVYDDSLSYLEFLGKVSAKLNELINANAAQDAALVEFLSQFDTNLTTTVTTYLDTWLLDGTLQAILTAALDAFTDAEAAHEASVAATIAAYQATVNGQIAAVEASVEDLETDLVEIQGLPYNAKGHGALGDGIADDTVALQAAIDAATAAGREVYIPAGTYLISATLYVPQSAKIRGDGFRKTFIRTTGAFIAMMTNGTSGSPVYYITIRDLSLVGNGLGLVGLELQYTRESHFSNLLITSFDIGLKLNWSFSNGFTSCAINDNRDTNIQLGAQSNDVLFTDIKIDNGGNYGVTIIADGQGITFVGCVFQGSGKEAVRASAGHTLNFIGCYFENNNKNQVALTYDLAFVGDVQAIKGVMLSGCQIWSKYAVASIYTDKVDQIVVIGGAIKLLAGYTTTQSVKTTANTINLKLIAVQLDQVASNKFDIVTTESDGQTYFKHWNTGTLNMDTIFTITGASRVEFQKILDMNGNTIIGALVNLSTVAAATPTNNMLFVDSADNKLKFKDSTGTVKTVTLV
jgi:hypothetical protein